MKTKSEKILIGAQQIMDYLSISRDLFRELVALGMPVAYYRRRYYAYSDNIEAWFRQMTMGRYEDPPDEPEANGAAAINGG